MMEKKDSFVMYGSFLESAEQLDGETFKEFILKIRDYALKGIDEPSDNPSIKMLMPVVKPLLDRAKKRYEDAKSNGAKGAGHG